MFPVLPGVRADWEPSVVVLGAGRTGVLGLRVTHHGPRQGGEVPLLQRGQGGEGGEMALLQRG